MKFSASTFSATAELAAPGCASTMISDDAITDRTAAAIDLNKGAFTISNRRDKGASTRCTARSKSGQEYNCTLGGTMSIMGAQITDALWKKKGEAPKNPLVS